MEVEKKLITPAIAARMLENHSGNRALSQAAVDMYARDMKAGRWKPSGNTISVAPNGRLLNGQHRLWAIIEANVEIEFIIVTEDSDDVHRVFDIGRKRQGAQILTLEGVDNSTIVRGVADKYMRYVKCLNLEVPGIEGTSAGNERWRETKPWQHGMLTGPELNEFCLDHQRSLEDIVIYTTEFHAEFGKGKIWYGSLAYIVKQLSDQPYRWQEFHNAVTTGTMLTEGDPRFALRRHIIRNDTPRSIWDNQFNIALGLIAWNKWLANKQVKMLRYSKNMLPMVLVK